MRTSMGSKNAGPASRSRIQRADASQFLSALRFPKVESATRICNRKLREQEVGPGVTYFLYRVDTTGQEGLFTVRSSAQAQA